jgi:alpha-tubulin suppressor-like RCC1 family protein
MEASKPKVVTTLNDKRFMSVCAGGMHSLCLTTDGVVYSFGCNDDGALGRITGDDSEIYTPGESMVFNSELYRIDRELIKETTSGLFCKCFIRS